MSISISKIAHDRQTTEALQTNVGEMFKYGGEMYEIIEVMLKTRNVNQRATFNSDIIGPRFRI